MLEEFHGLVCLAKKHNLYSKIDPFEEDIEYFEKWNEKLEEYDSIISNCPDNIKINDIKTCNPNDYININQKIESIKKNFNNDIDLSELKTFVENVKTIKSKYSTKNKNKTNELAGEKIRRTVFVIDADWENFGDGSNVILYCRDIKTNETFCLLFQYDDYFFVKITKSTNISDVKKALKNFEWYMKQNVSNITEAQKSDMKTYHKSEHKMNKNPSDIGGIQYVSSTKCIHGHKSIYGYQPHEDYFLQVHTKYVNFSKRFFKSASKNHPEWELFETDVDYITKFFTEYDISACIPITFEGVVQKTNHVSSCDNLVKCSNIERFVENGQSVKYTPIMYYWDIECLSLQPGVFPKSDICPIIQISYLVCKGEEEIKRGVLCLKDTPLEYAESFDTEEQMLIRFAQTILQYSPDAIAGFNSNVFDMPYVIDRMKVLNIYHFASIFCRRKGFKVDYSREFKQSNQQGTREVVKYITPGFVMFDFYESIRADVTIRLRSYSLKSICAAFLKNDNKEDLDYEEIPELFTTPEGRARIASYCMKDTLLLKDLDKVLQLGTNAWSMAQVLGTTPNIVLNRGLVFKLMCKLKQYSTKFKLLIPTFTYENKPTFTGSFEGAFVLDPECGFHKDPIVTLDFKSLYPSLMIAYNLSYETLVLNKEWVEEKPENFEQHCGEWFVKQSVYKGVIPCLEEELAKERSKAKKMRDKFPEGSDEYNVYESLQLANKVIMNSLYGMLGSKTASVPMVQVAKTITGLGRENLLMAKDYVEKHYVDIVRKEFPDDPIREPCKVIYGDTDSIFIKMPGVTLEDSIKYGKMLNRYTQTHVFQDRPPMELEYEKVFCPFIITRRKGYCGAKYTDDAVNFKVATMGFQVVRRDNAKICLEVMQGFLDRVFKENDTEAARKYVKAYIEDLFEERIPLEKYVITKKIAKSEYTTEPPHITAWKKMVERVGESRAPRVGSRFEYVVTQLDKKAGMKSAIIDYELAKTLDHVNFDKIYYFTTFISNPLKTISEYILGVKETEELLNPKNYSRKDTVVAQKNNILGFFGVKTLVKRKKLL